MEFSPTETWLLEEPLSILLEAVRYETDHVSITESDGEALLESTQAPGTYGHIAVLHRRDSLGGVSTVPDDPADERLVRASFQHDDSPRTASVQRALQPYRVATVEH